MSISLDEMIAIIQSNKDGKDIEYRRIQEVDDSWKPYDLNRELARGFELRIKPESPKPRKFWIHDCPDATPRIRLYKDNQTFHCPNCKPAIHVREVLPKDL